MTAWLLSLLDFLLGIPEPVKFKPSPPIHTLARNKASDAGAASGTAIDDFHDFPELRDFYKETHSEMRALRDTEFKIVALYYQVSAFVFAGNMATMASTSATYAVKSWTGTLSVFFLLIFWGLVHRRIAHDHQSYSFHIEYKRYLESKWFGDEFSERPPNTANTKSAGPGYRKTQALIALSALSVCTLIVVAVALHAPKFCH